MHLAAVLDEAIPSSLTYSHGVSVDLALTV